MSDQNDGFESVGDSNPMWNPRQTGSKKTNDFVELQANDKSWITGYYHGCKTGIGSNNATVHTIQVEKVGDRGNINGEVDKATKKVDFWGSGVLDGKIADNITPGQMIRIVWKGLQQPKKAGGNTYHGWDLQINHNVEPIVVAGGAMPTATPTENVAPQASTSDSEGDDSDLPF